MYSELHPFLTTVEQKRLLLEELDLLAKSLYTTTAQAFEKTLQEHVRPEVCAVLVRLFEGKDREHEVKALQAYISSLEEAQVSLVFTPGSALVQKMAAAIAGEGDPKVLSFREDPTLLAGAVISYKGKYADGSLKNKLATFAKTPEFTTLISSILSK